MNGNELQTIPRPEVEILTEEEVLSQQSNELMLREPGAIIQIGIITIGKIPGQMMELETQEGVTLRKLFERIGLKPSDLEKCTIQTNGNPASLDDEVVLGSQVIAVANIKGN